MSNSLTINAPKIVQQNTSLRGVPSGSTAQPDDNVKYVPQTLTEEQQAQARQNIGAGTSDFSGDYDDLSNKPTIPAAQIQSDWNQTDDTAADYIKNKPNISGGAAAELDKYWTIYALGDTTFTMHAGTVNKVWMNGTEIQAVEGTYSINAFATVRVDASANAPELFSNS